MIHPSTDTQTAACQHGRQPAGIIQLYPGIALSYHTLASDHLSMHHGDFNHILEINYCRSGRIGWTMGNGCSVYLGQNDISLHTMKTCADCVMSLPTGSYEGLTICVDLKELTEKPPAALAGAGITESCFYHKFFKGSPIASIAGNEQTETIFSAFYGQPEQLRLPYQKIKALEALLYLNKLEINPQNQLTEYKSEQVETIREIHEQLIRHMEQRFTIEALSKQYLMNPTTLKTMFKSVYGTSIAAHMKEHRMEQAAKLLQQTSLSIAEIAKRVGYDSQSKFTAAFKEYCGKLPRDYRSQL